MFRNKRTGSYLLWTALVEFAAVLISMSYINSTGDDGAAFGILVIVAFVVACVSFGALVTGIADSLLHVKTHTAPGIVFYVASVLHVMLSGTGFWLFLRT